MGDLERRSEITGDTSIFIQNPAGNLNSYCLYDTEALKYPRIYMFPVFETDEAKISVFNDCH